MAEEFPHHEQNEAVKAASLQQNNQRVITKLVLLVFGMFGFGFALVPLYDVFCDITGLNGKPSDTAAIYRDVTVDTKRTVTVEFMTRNHAGMSWKFEPVVRRIEVHPGEINTVDFYAQNPTGEFIVGQAVPSVAPSIAAIYLNKTECFCFNHQALASGEEVNMPMQFYIDPSLPEDIEFFTLSYTLFDVTDKTTISMTNSTKMSEEDS